MEYDKEFEGWFGSWWISGDFGSTSLAKDAAWYAWQAARKDHYRIGEEVLITGLGTKAIVSAVDAEGIKKYVNPVSIYRVPAWKPKEGVAVMFPWYTDENTRVWCAGTYHNGMIYFGDDYSAAAVEHCKPFSADKIGKPWEEI